MLKKLLIILAVFGGLSVLAACGGAPPTPETIVETVVVRETVEVEVEKEVVVTREVEVEKEVEKIVTVEVEKEVVVVETVEVEKEVPVVETVEVERVVEVEVLVTPTPTPEPTADPTNPVVRDILNNVSFVQHTYDRELDRDVFTCISMGQGLEGAKDSSVVAEAESPVYVGPNDGDFSLWGANGLFKIDPDGTTTFVPQRTGDKFVDPDLDEYTSFTQEEALTLFADGDAIWTGDHGAAGRIAECDPGYAGEE